MCNLQICCVISSTPWPADVKCGGYTSHFTNYHVSPEDNPRIQHQVLYLYWRHGECTEAEAHCCQAHRLSSFPVEVLVDLYVDGGVDQRPTHPCNRWTIVCDQGNTDDILSFDETFYSFTH